ncbi:hypothetical protein C1T30_43000, partial [Bacillus sp. MBGLi97]
MQFIYFTATDYSKSTMITLQLKNRHIYFALEAIWTELDYRFKYQINQLVSENDEDDYLQTIQVDKATLNQ